MRWALVAVPQPLQSLAQAGPRRCSLGWGPETGINRSECFLPPTVSAYQRAHSPCSGCCCASSAAPEESDKTGPLYLTLEPSPHPAHPI